MVILLINNGADINYWTITGTALHDEVLNGNLNLIRYLLNEYRRRVRSIPGRFDEFINEQDQFSDMVLDKVGGNIAVANLLRSYGAN
jgi:ankyrin repeat protein